MRAQRHWLPLLLSGVVLYHLSVTMIGATEWLRLATGLVIHEDSLNVIIKPADAAIVGQNLILLHSYNQQVSRISLTDGRTIGTWELSYGDTYRMFSERDRRRSISRFWDLYDVDSLIQAEPAFSSYLAMRPEVTHVVNAPDSLFAIVLAQRVLGCGEHDSYFTIPLYAAAILQSLNTRNSTAVIPDVAGEYWPQRVALYIDTAGTYWLSTFLLDNHAKVFDAQPFLCAFDSDGVPLSRCVYLPVEAAKRKGYVYLQNSVVELYPGLVATVSVRYPQLVVFDTESLQSVAFEVDTLLPPRGLNVASRSYEFVASNKAGTIEYVLADFDSTGTRMGHWLIRHTIDRSATVASILRTETEPVPLSITLGPGASAPYESTKTTGARSSTIRRLVMHDDEWYVVTTGLQSTTD